MKIIKLAFDKTPLESGHKVRGMGFYTKRLLEALEQNKNIKLVEDVSTADILHVPYYDLFYRTLHVSDVPTVVTVGDVTPLLYPKAYPPGIKGKINFWRQKKELGKAAAVITFTEAAKKDIVRFLGINHKKVFPVHLGPGNPTSLKLRGASKYSLPEKYVLYVGDINYNKNVLRLIKACKKIKMPLVIVGQSAVSENYDENHIENRDLRELQEKYGADPDVIRLGFVPEEDFYSVWKNATVYCQPSLYEGFGLALLEAFQVGVPVASSRTQALVEVGENACIYFDPYIIDDMAAKLKKIISSEFLRKDLVSKGKERLKNFSWKKTARETVKIYTQVL